MNIIAIQVLIALAPVGQFGGSTLPFRPPVSTIGALSLPADDDSPAMVLHVYRLKESTEKDPHPTAEELVPLVRDIVAADSWETDGAYLRAVNNHLLVRQTAQAQREIRGLLVELDALTVDPRGCGGLISVIPVVGERRATETPPRR